MIDDVRAFQAAAENASVALVHEWEQRCAAMNHDPTRMCHSALWHWPVPSRPSLKSKYDCFGRLLTVLLPFGERFTTI
jgi:hypothetical protein